MTPLVWYVVSSALLLSLALLALYVSRRLPGTSTHSIRIIDRTALEPGRSLYVIEVGGRCLLVGGGAQLSVLAELDAAKLPAATTRARAPSRALERAVRALRGEP